MGAIVDGVLRARIRSANDRVRRTPHWVMRQALLAHGEKIESGNRVVFAGECGKDRLNALPDELKPHVQVQIDSAILDALLYEGDGDHLKILTAQVTNRPGPLASIQRVLR
ncbi:trifunctional transcriptional regulator/proline dehydrogenase/pyrroline-5-carboxylate dehydrogenase [Caballeronia choica]|uniref:Trifunctional transcriptional regulator/proline dehydrogenase/pyrroline-5-carboxylate dehydrogenase n=1 Tax=Caballeronia choica TaxID=326476 RepID=A0A158KZZ5_9BURK|nr:trifunctional transcriptional regulator/proline dehydrogenase/pyrroline-5-carboxylate dehydrogenase [Caballeronia choica]